MPIGVDRRGSRVYFTGNTFDVKDQIKQIGGHWDGGCKQWWVGASKESDARALLATLANAPAKTGPGDDARVYAKVEYKNRKYFVIAESADRCRLTVLDGSVDFWTDKSACNVLKIYQPREVRLGRYTSKTRTVYTTFGSLRDFVADQKDAEAAGLEACAACGKRGQLHHDLEDGLMKCFTCCDMPAN